MANLAAAALLSIASASRLCGVSQSTLRRWEEEGTISAYRTSGNHRRYCRDDLMRHLGEEPQSSEASIIIYARLSSQKQTKVQEGGLEGQIEECRNFIREKYNRKEDHVYSDIASGLNYERSGLTKLLEEVIGGKWYGSIVVVAHKDRLARYGASFIEKVFSKFGVQIEYINAHDKDSDAELVDDLLNIMNYYVARKNGKRCAAKRKQFISPELKDKIIRLWKDGMFGKDIYVKLHADGDTCLNGTRVPVKMIYRLLNSQGIKTRRGRPTKAAAMKADQAKAKIEAEKSVANLGSFSCAAQFFSARLRCSGRRSTQPLTLSRLSRCPAISGRNTGQPRLASSARTPKQTTSPKATRKRLGNEDPARRLPKIRRRLVPSLGLRLLLSWLKEPVKLWSKRYPAARSLPVSTGSAKCNQVQITRRRKPTACLDIFILKIGVVWQAKRGGCGNDECRRTNDEEERRAEIGCHGHGLAWP